MNSFMQYYSKHKPKYTYKVKLAVEDVTDKMIDKLIQCLGKYDIQYASEFKSTPIQHNPLDFPQLKNTPVYISLIELNYPATSQYLQNKIAQCLGIGDQRVVVYTENDPREDTTIDYVERMVENYKEYEPVLGKDDYEGERGSDNSMDYQTHKTDFLKELEAHRQERDFELQQAPSEDYHSYLETAEESSPGLFGRMKPKD